ncbi:hypothetical protein [Roseobacter litoralis]|uniref:hypothetical protein n=1 Tax=Roseobacter litoralis TaxID=42443 RepID=UPI0024949F96|nr:hypothetical protein [Roseobacter litoralis]
MFALTKPPGVSSTPGGLMFLGVPMSWNITNNIKEVQRGLNDATRKQIPFAASVAINSVLNDIKRNFEKRLRRVLNNPTPFTLKAVAVRRANKRTLTGTVFIKDIQAGYLKWLEDGGRRQPNRRAILVPVRQRVNKYGNLPRGAVRRTLAKATTFSGAPKGKPGAAGVYQRVGKGRTSKLKLLLHYADAARYKPRLGFNSSARRTAEARLPGAMLSAIRKAVSTRR